MHTEVWFEAYAVYTNELHNTLFVKSGNRDNFNFF